MIAKLEVSIYHGAIIQNQPECPHCGFVEELDIPQDY